ncbi:hypothetical protein B9Z55_018927 [Caenorhabditis nigoni]|uniref:Uncharacterized protein n=1 Tax=Caenorhabditis nigoni TaxID=1611254 RepID=A0A2G5TGC7_9PELO|nr:hypothetical protein B9Z55_018927 [Caenorhabditis nigoni]
MAWLVETVLFLFAIRQALPQDVYGAPQQPYPYVQPSASSGSGSYIPNPQSSIHTVQQPYPNVDVVEPDVDSVDIYETEEPQFKVVNPFFPIGSYAINYCDKKEFPDEVLEQYGLERLFCLQHFLLTYFLPVLHWPNLLALLHFSRSSIR